MCSRVPRAAAAPVSLLMFNDLFFFIYELKLNVFSRRGGGIHVRFPHQTYYRCFGFNIYVKNKRSGHFVSDVNFFNFFFFFFVRTSGSVLEKQAWSSSLI